MDAFNSKFTPGVLTCETKYKAGVKNNIIMRRKILDLCIPFIFGAWEFIYSGGLEFDF
jgi:hypothetical protein